MRRYEYRCQTCGRHFKITSSDSEDEQAPECPNCQSQDIEFKLSSLFVPEERPNPAATLARTSVAIAGNCGSRGPFR